MSRFGMTRSVVLALLLGAGLAALCLAKGRVRRWMAPCYVLQSLVFT